MEVGRSAAREVLEALQDAGVFVPVEGKGAGGGNRRNGHVTCTKFRGAWDGVALLAAQGGGWVAPRGTPSALRCAAPS